MMLQTSLSIPNMYRDSWMSGYHTCDLLSESAFFVGKNEKARIGCFVIICDFINEVHDFVWML